MSFLPSDNWASILNRLGSPFNWILTKEGYALINAFITSREFILLANFYQFLARLSTNDNFFNILLKAIVIRSLGAILINDKQIAINAIVQTIGIQKDMYIALVNVLNTLTTTIPSVAFNPIANAKWASILSAVLVAISSTGTEIGNLKNDLRAIISRDTFCLTPCTEFRPLMLQSSNVEDIRKEYTKIISDLKRIEREITKEDIAKK
jgi:hypothetical protein